MADTTLTLNAGSGGNTIAVDNNVTTGDHQYVKLKFGPSGTQTTVTAAAGLPVTPDSGGFAVTATLDAETTKVIGTVNIAAGQSVAATQNGTWNITNVSGTVSLPTGAATETTLAAINTKLTSGTVIGDVNLGATDAAALALLDDTVVAQGAALGTTKNSLIGGSVTTNAPTYTTGQISPLSLTTSGELRVSAAAGSAEITDDTTTLTGQTASVGIAMVATPTNTTLDADDWGVPAISLDRRQLVDADIAIDGTSITGGAGAVGASTPRVTLASDDPAVASLAILDDSTVAIGTALGSTKNVLMGGSVTTAAPSYTTGQIHPFSLDTSGALRVTGGGGGTEYTEDDAAAANPVGTALILVREDARAGSLTSLDGDNVALRGNNKGEAYVIDTDANALLTTIDADTSTIAGDTTSIDGKLPTAAAAADNFANPTTTNIMAMGMLWDGATWDRMLGDSTNGVLVNLGTNNDVTVTSGTITLGAGTAEIGKLAAGSAVIGALTANQSVNVAQMNGVTTTMGNGASGTGVQRVTIASDSTGVIGHNTTGMVSGRTTSAATATVLGTAAAKWVIVQAETNNTGEVAIGDSGVAHGTDGVVLAPGESITIPVSNINQVYVDSAVSGDGVNFVYGT